MTVVEILALFRQIVEVVLKFVPHELLAAELDAAAKARADAIADAAEAAKFGGS